MRKHFAAAAVCSAILALGSCDDGLVHGEEGLKKIGEELGGYELVGTVSGSWETTAWYACGDDDGNENIRAVRLGIKGKDTWENRGADLGLHKFGDGLYEIMADHGYSFYVNDENCKRIMLITGSQTETADVSEYPFITYMERNYQAETEYSDDMVTTSSYGIRYFFLDADNNVIAGT